MQVRAQDNPGIQILGSRQVRIVQQVFGQASHRKLPLPVRSLMHGSVNGSIPKQGNHLAKKVGGDHSYLRRAFASDSARQTGRQLTVLM